MALLWSLLVVDPLIILSTIVCGSISIVVSFFDPSGQAQNGIARTWARSILVFAGVRVKVEGLEKLNPQAGYVFVSNHLSYMDTPVVLGRIPGQFRFLAKKGLFQIPFLGTHLKRAGHIPVPLDDPRASIRALTRAAEVIREHGISLLIFPEGGRSIDGMLQPFKEGAAYIAIKAKAPLVPIALIGTRHVMAMGSATIHRGAVVLRIGDPIPTDRLTLHDRQALTDTVRERIAGMLSMQPAAAVTERQ